MPFKSKSQQRFMHAAASRGDIPEKTVHEWDESTKKKKGGFKKLPEYAGLKKKASRISDALTPDMRYFNLLGEDKLPSGSILLAGGGLGAVAGGQLANMVSGNDDKNRKLKSLAATLGGGAAGLYLAHKFLQKHGSVNPFITGFADELAKIGG